MPPRVDYTGQRFGRLVVIEDTYKTHCKCKCDCGVIKDVLRKSLSRIGTKSCGCLQRDTISAMMRTHGKSVGNRTYRCWSNMRRRCLTTTGPNYSEYGGRGITIQDSWSSFDNFLQDMGDCPPEYSLDRIDVNGPYSKENCRWASHKEQQNNKRNSKLIVWRGESLTMQQWSERVGLPRATLRSRLDSGWALDSAFTEPKKKKGRGRRTKETIVKQAEEKLRKALEDYLKAIEAPEDM